MVNRSTANGPRSTADCGMTTIRFHDYNLLTTSCQRSIVHRQWRLQYALSLQLQFAVVCRLWTVDKNGPQLIVVFKYDLSLQLQFAVDSRLWTVDKMWSTVHG
jgi:hypothetical protein